jgi:hypothetical protein
MHKNSVPALGRAEIVPLERINSYYLWKMVLILSIIVNLEVQYVGRIHSSNEAVEVTYI